MQYDPVKKTLGKFFNRSPFLRKLFYRILDFMLLRTWHIKKHIRQWSRNYPDKAFILDAGSGFGQYSYYLASKNRKWQVIGVDVKTKQIEDCNNFFNKIGLKNAAFQEADLTKFHMESGFDLILTVDVMEHIEDDVQVFRNFFNYMKQGGMLLISTPSDQGGSDVHDDGHGSFIDEHVRDGYAAEEISEKLIKAGFTRTETCYVYGTPGKISWKLTMKWPIQLLGISRIFFLILPVYYLVAFPFLLLLNFLDVYLKHKTGTGLIVKAWK